jgi:hypothetical protein
MIRRVAVLGAGTFVVLLAMNVLSPVIFPGVSRELGQALFFAVIVLPALFGVALAVRLLFRRTKEKA